MKPFENLLDNIVNGNISSSKEILKSCSRKTRYEFIMFLDDYKGVQEKVIKWCILEEWKITKTVNGEKYVQVAEEISGNCTGCVANNDDLDYDLCELLHDEDYCAHTKMIYKLKENQNDAT